jgi:hypothetical protein
MSKLQSIFSRMSAGDHMMIWPGLLALAIWWHFRAKAVVR